MFSIIVPNHNGYPYLERCLSSLQAQSLKGYEIIVVDNGSSDDSLTFIRKHFPAVKLVPLNENKGFVHAVNAGIGRAQYPYIALLNNDTEVDPSWLENIQRAFSRRPDVDCVTSKMVQFHDRAHLDGAGDEYTRGGLAMKLGRGLSREEFDSERETFSACAGACIFKKEIFEKVGLFDEDFFANYEDVDFSLRMKAVGHKILYVPDVVVYHIGGATLGGVTSKLAVTLTTRNMINVIVKDWPGVSLIKFLPFIVLHQTYWLLLCVKWGRTLSYIQGLLGVIKQSRKTLIKRKEVQESRKISGREFMELIRCSESEVLKVKLQNSTGLGTPLWRFYAFMSGLRDLI
jgi:GT2 family glycosyltransferase